MNSNQADEHATGAVVHRRSTSPGDGSNSSMDASMSAGGISDGGADGTNGNTIDVDMAVEAMAPAIESSSSRKRKVADADGSEEGRPTSRGPPPHPNRTQRQDTPTPTAAEEQREQTNATQCDERTRTVGAPQWATLHRDYIESITKFLDLKQFILTSRVCIGWRNESSRVGHRSDSVRLESWPEFDEDRAAIERRHRVSLKSLCELPSAFTRHVTHLYLRDLKFNQSGLERICAALTRLTHLECGIDPNHRDEDETESESESHRIVPSSSGAAASAAPFPLPPTLTSIDLTIPYSTNHDDPDLSFDGHWHRLMRTLCDLPVLSDLALRIDLAADPSPLVTLFSRVVRSLWILPLREKLTQFEFGIESDEMMGRWHPVNDRLDPSDLTLLNQFTRLTHLQLGDRKWSIGKLNLLFGVPFTLTQLKYFNFGPTVITEDMAQSIARATGFTEFQPACIDLSDPSFIGAYKQLESCILTCSLVVDAGLLIAAVSQCTRMTDVDLTHPWMTADQLESLLSHLPLLNALCLREMSGLTSLAFLSRVSHLSSLLSSLTVMDCRMIPPGEVDHFRSLRALTLLEPLRSFTTPLSSAVIAEMTPGSPHFRADLWPNLTDLNYPG